MSSNLTLSYELILLMGWLLNREKSKLRKLVKTAVENGFSQELEQFDTQDQTKTSERLHSTIIDFLIFLEEALIENLETIEFDALSKEKLAPTLKKIDLQNIDVKALWTSLQQVKAEMSKYHKKISKNPLSAASASAPSSVNEPQKMLWELLLKNWNPEKKEQVN